jgi:selenocysteine lyase/cysteine desulfurase
MSQPDSIDNRQLTRQFPILEQGLYLNHAAIAPWPRVCTRAVQDFAQENSTHGPGRYREWIAREKRLRRNLARLLGAQAADIALLKNTTEGISMVAAGLDWKPGDNIVLPLGEFPSNRLPWEAQRDRGVEIRVVDIRAAAHAEHALIAAMDENTRLLSVSAVQWSDGFRLDLEKLGRSCRAQDVLFFVDAIQQLGALPLDVDDCHIDFLAADAHKWLLGPEGIAVFYCRETVRPRLRLSQQGWHMVDNPWNFDRPDWTPSASARRFEAGSPNSLGQVALDASVSLLLEIGMDRISHRILDNTDFLMNRLAALPGIEVSSRTEMERRSGIVSCRPLNHGAGDLYRSLLEHRVSCALRHGQIRFSPHFYQDRQVLSGLLELLESLLRN